MNSGNFFRNQGKVIENYSKIEKSKFDFKVKNLKNYEGKVHTNFDKNDLSKRNLRLVDLENKNYGVVYDKLNKKSNFRRKIIAGSCRTVIPHVIKEAIYEKFNDEKRMCKKKNKLNDKFEGKINKLKCFEKDNLKEVKRCRSCFIHSRPTVILVKYDKNVNFTNF